MWLPKKIPRHENPIAFSKNIEKKKDGKHNIKLN